MVARRTVLGSALLPFLAGRTSWAAPGMDRLDATWASGVVQAYDAQGHHRTGLLADLENAGWLAREAAALGASVAVEETMIDRVEPADCYLDVDGRRIEGTPMFDAAFTGENGVTGRLGTGPGAEIGLATLGPLSIYGPAYEPYRRAPGSRALVTVTQGGRDGLALFNAEHFLEPYGVPDLLVASGHGPALADAAARGASVRVVADVRRVSSPLRNVVATVAGRDPSARPVVVMTPRSGWWHCASERGGGIACWLAVLAALRDAPPAASVTLVASSGHELGHIGLDGFMAKRPQLVSGATWLHFGANIGTAGGKLTLQSPNEDLRALGTRELQVAGHPADAMSPPTQVPFGESRAIHRAGGRYLTFVGTGDLFHLVEDRWPHAVDPDAIAGYAAAASRIALAMAG